MDFQMDGWLLGSTTGVGVADGITVGITVGVIAIVDVAEGARVTVAVAVGNASR